MKNFRLIAMAGFMACCFVLFGSQSDSYGQGHSGKSRGNSGTGVTHSTDAIQRGIERITSNRSQRARNSNRDLNYDRDDNNQYMSGYRNRRNRMHTNNGVRDHGRGIGRGKGQGKGRGYTKRNRNH